MNRQILLNSLLTLHVTGLVMMAGTTIVDYSTFTTFWKLIDQGKGKSMGLLRVTEKYARLIGIGAAVLVFTGIGMMALTNGIFGEQLWFRIKFALVIILILNAILVGRRQGSKLRKVIAESDPDLAAESGDLRSALNRFYLSQLILFFIIIFLSVFRFS